MEAQLQALNANNKQPIICKDGSFLLTGQHRLPSFFHILLSEIALS